MRMPAEVAGHLRGEDAPLPSFHDDRPEIQALFEAALEARLPRARELKAWEPQRLNERHLAMVMLRAQGVKQRQIARAFGATDSNVSIVLNHPDAELLLAKLQAMKATQPGDIEKRLQALTEPAMEVLEAAFQPLDPQELKDAMRRAPLAFRVLEMNGHARKKEVKHEHEHRHQHRLEASPAQLGALTTALRETREIEEQKAVVLESGEEAQALLESPGGASEAAGPSGTAAPSSGGPQEQSEEQSAEQEEQE